MFFLNAHIFIFFPYFLFLFLFCYRPVPLCCGQAVNCDYGCSTGLILSCMYDKVFSGCCGGFVDNVNVVYFDDAAFSSNPCCTQSFIPQGKTCYQCICYKLTCGVCCNVSNVLVAKAPPCCPCCKCCKQQFLDDILDPRSTANILNTAVKNYSKGSAVTGAQLSAAGKINAPIDIEMARN